MFAGYLILLLKLASSVDVLPVFRGFDATWRRKLVGFETPHRISRLDNYISSNGSSLFANFGLSPGVDGDFAYPELYYDLLVTDHYSNISTIKKLTFQWRDNATRSNGSKWLSAEAEFAKYLASGDHVIFLGFSINTTCVDPDCGQHGVWLSFFRVGIDENRYAFLRMTRTESPDSEETDDFGKPFIKQMAFTASIYYIEVNGFALHNEPIIFYNDTIHSDGQTTKVEVTDPLSYLGSTVGISALGFELLNTDATKDLPLGRYIESMHFESELLPNSETVQAPQAELSFNVRSPSLTTHEAGVRYFLQPVSISPIFSRGLTSGTSKGSICVSGDQVGKIHLNRTFVCANHGLKDQVMDHTVII